MTDKEYIQQLEDKIAGLNVELMMCRKCWGADRKLLEDARKAVYELSKTLMGVKTI